MRNFKKIGAMALIGFFVGWALLGIYLFIFPVQGPVYGGPSATQYMAYGGLLGLALGAIRGFWITRGNDPEE